VACGTAFKDGLNTCLPDERLRHHVERRAVNSISTARHPVSEQFASGSVEVV
jgi:hypothetical protein